MKPIVRWAAWGLVSVLGKGIGSTYAQNSSVPGWPIHNNGLSDIVQWDHYSFLINGKRAFLFSGELHYWRLPVPELWEDVLQKIKASGCNAFAIYGHWGFHAHNATSLDFETGAHDFTRLFDLAHKLGLYVFVRPGPYVNAETNGGGFPLWVTTGEYGSLRNNDTGYTEAWTPFMTEFDEITTDYQVTRGGNALAYQVENEYGEQWKDRRTKTPNPVGIHYMELLEDSARANGIDIPLFHNNPNMNSKSWSKDYGAGVGGNVDVYGLDSYPACWSCNLDECTDTNGPYVPFKVMSYYEHFQEVSPTQPSFMPEFQGGSYNPPGGPQGGCLENSNEDFANVYYRHNIAERVTAMSLYMFFGGTNWGWLAAPVVMTSYDYSAPVSEDRSIGPKYYETKNLALFTRVAEDITMTERIGTGAIYSTNPAVIATELRNPDTNAAFYVTLHTNSSSGSLESFKLHVSTSIGNITVPQKVGGIDLNGHQSKIIATDFRFGNKTLAYSTADVLTYAVFDGHPTLVLWVPTGESGEFFVKDAMNGTIGTCGRCSNVNFYPDSNGLLVTFTQDKGSTVLHIDRDTRVIVLDRTSAYPFWAPTLSPDPLVSPEDTVLVQGPYLVRGAVLDDSTVALTGDADSATEIEVFAPKSVQSISWNGKGLHTKATNYGSLIASVGAPATFTPPALGSWRVQDSLPERFANYTATSPAWVTADHTSSPSFYPPETFPSLYVDEYGFHTGVALFRGTFSGSATGVYLSVQGGPAFGWSAFLNGEFIGSFLGSVADSSGNLTLSFSNSTISATGENVLLVISDNSGHDQRAGALNPRGIINATLLGDSANSTTSNTTFTSWKIAGSAGGSTNPIDPLRGPLNEGGLAAERLGWHLPSFDDSSWPSVASPSSPGFRGAGIKFYRTIFPLDIPNGLDVGLSFRLGIPGDTGTGTNNNSTSGSVTNKLRALLFINGYQYGRFNPWIGHQLDFPVPPGVLDYHGKNTMGLAVWAQSDEGARVDVELKLNWVVESGFQLQDTSYLREEWDEGRLEYA